jgi:IS5 family transposase
LEGFQYSAPFDPSMMVHFRKLPESVVNGCNEQIALHGLNVIRSYAANDRDDDDSHQGDATGRSDHQQTQSNTTKHIQGSLLIDATCSPAAIRHLTD